MESNRNLTNEPTRKTGTASGSTGSAGTPSGSTGSTGTQNNVSAATQRARETAQSAIDQTKQVMSDAYEKTSEVLSNTYDKTVTYGRENPGTATLIAFGAGIGVGVLLAAALSGGRSRTNRIAEPIVNALSQVAMEFLR